MIESLYMSTAIQDNKPKAKIPKLTPKQKAWVEAYLSVGEHTYLNGAQSALKVYDTSDPNTATSIGSENLTKPAVLNYMEEVSARHGMGVEERTQLVADVLKGVHRNTTDTTHYDADGNVRGVTHVEKSLSPTEIARLVDLQNKGEGVYSKVNVSEHKAKLEHEAVIAAMRADMKEVIASHRKRG